MSTIIQGDQVRAIQAGILVSKSATVLVTNSANALFTVSTGIVQINALFGRVTSAVANTASLTGKFTYTPSGGSIADLTAATAIDNDAVGTYYGWSFPDGDELTSQLTEGGTEVPSVNFVPKLNPPAFLGPGAVTFTVSNHDPGTGAVKWFCLYTPIEAGSTVSVT